MGVGALHTGRLGKAGEGQEKELLLLRDFKREANLSSFFLLKRLFARGEKFCSSPKQQWGRPEADGHRKNNGFLPLFL